MEKICEFCKQVFESYYSSQRFCSHPCWLKYQVGENNPTTNKTLKKGKTVYKSRLIMDDFLGRKLGSTEVVHHINMNSRDIRLENLYLFDSQSTHLKCHYSLDALVKLLLNENSIRFDFKKGIYLLGKIFNLERRNNGKEKCSC